MPSAERETPVLPDRGSFWGLAHGSGFRHLVRFGSRRRAQNVSVQFLQPVKFSHPRSEKLLRLSAL